MAESYITTKFFQLHPEYMGTRRILVTICNVPANLPGDVIAPFLSAYGKLEDMEQLRATAGTAHIDYVFRLCLNREGFQAIPDTIHYRDRQMIVMIEGRWSHSWNCKQLRKFHRKLSLKTTSLPPKKKTTSNPTMMPSKPKETTKDTSPAFNKATAASS